MPRMRPRSIRHKLNWVVLATTFVALSLAGLAMVIFDLSSYQRTWERDLLTQADLLGLATAPALSFNDPKAARENLALLKARPNITAAAVYTPDGRVFATYGDSAKGGAAPAGQADGVRIEGGDLIAFKNILEERVRQRTSQLEVANRELEAFSYSASHDLRAPLHTIDSFSSLLEKSVHQHLDERGRHYLNRIQVNARLMADLIDALLTLAHVSRATLERSTVDLGAMALAALERCQEADPGRAAVIDVADGMEVRADPTLVNQVVQNLVVNAWKFTSKTAVASIAVGCAPRAGDGPVTFFVRDNGAGFDMAYADKLFSAFQRLHSANEFPGTGIGLATVHKIVTRHEGKIWAESAPGQGATFFFTLDNGL